MFFYTFAMKTILIRREDHNSLHFGVKLLSFKVRKLRKHCVCVCDIAAYTTKTWTRYKI